MNCKISKTIGAASKEDARMIRLQALKLGIELLDRAIFQLLWAYAGGMLLTALLLPISIRFALWAIVPGLIFAFVAHLFHETASNFREYPYWRSFEQRRIDRNYVSLPLAVTALILVLALFHNKVCGDGIVFFIGVMAIDLFWALSSARSSDSLYCALKHSLMDERNERQENEKEAPQHAYAVVLEKDLTHEPEIEVIEQPETTDELMVSTQTCKRAQSGEVRVLGQSLIEFEKDSELTLAYISFCPPFESIPEFEFELIADEDVKVKATSIQPYGVRLEARRTLEVGQEDQGCVCTLEYFATVETETKA